MFLAIRSWCDILNRLRASEQGGVLVYIAFMLPMLMGAIALSVDLGRAFILNTELKDFSDAAALAGAAELDGRDGARAASEAAARTGLSGTLVNVQAFATDSGGPGIVVNQIVHLRNLPADGTDFTLNDTATSDADARFIFVSVVNRNIRSGLSRAVGVVSDYDTSARSIAGFMAVHCRVPAMMMCNPLEDDITPFPTADLDDCGLSDLGRGAALKEACLKSRQMLLKTAGKGSNYTPGNVGLLDCPSGDNGTNCIAPYVASATPGECVGAFANLRTGQAMGPIRTAINTRFDMYDAPFFQNAGDDPRYRPALNVVKGHLGSGCNSALPKNPADPPITMAYPKDPCFESDTCAGGRFGSGGWYQEIDHDNDAGTPDTEPYWVTNHPPQGGISVPQPPDYADMTRYDVYRYEIENFMVPDNDPGENANPSCYSGGTLSDPTISAGLNDPLSIDRRIITLAAVNCLAEGPLNGNVDNVPVLGFVDIFLTNPAEGKGKDQADIYGEIIGVSTPGTNGLRDIIQLYR